MNPTSELKPIDLSPIDLRRMAWELLERASKLTEGNEQYALNERAAQLSFVADEGLTVSSSYVWMHDMTWCGSTLPRGDEACASAGNMKIVRTHGEARVKDKIVERPRSRIGWMKIPPERSVEATQDENPHSKRGHPAMGPLVYDQEHLRQQARRQGW